MLDQNSWHTPPVIGKREYNSLSGKVDVYEYPVGVSFFLSHGFGRHPIFAWNRLGHSEPRIDPDFWRAPELLSLPEYTDLVCIQADREEHFLGDRIYAYALLWQSNSRIIKYGADLSSMSGDSIFSLPKLPGCHKLKYAEIIDYGRNMMLQFASDGITATYGHIGSLMPLTDFLVICNGSPFLLRIE